MGKSLVDRSLKITDKKQKNYIIGWFFLIRNLSKNLRKKQELSDFTLLLLVW